MGSVNKVILVGNLGADPELKYTQSNRPVCNLSVATNEVWKDKDGQKQEKVEWHRVQVWGDTAENCAKFLAKGRMVYLEGKLQTRQWEDKSGQKRYTTEIVAERVVFLGGVDGESKGRQQSSGGKQGWGGGQRSQGTNANNNDDRPPIDDSSDIPF